MAKLAEAWRRFSDLFHRRRRDAELREEMLHHLSLKIRANLDAGMGADDALHEAEREFGNSLRIHEESRDLWRWRILDGITLDFKHALRLFGEHPRFAIPVVLMLALGIGANVAMFSVVNAVLIRPLPYPQPRRLVFLTENAPQLPVMSIAFPNFEDWRTMNHAFDDMAPYLLSRAALKIGGHTQQVQIDEITADFVPTLEVGPILGRGLVPSDDRVGAPPVALLSDSFWERQFGGDPRVIGKSLDLDGESYTVIGVLPSSQFQASWRGVQLFTSLWRSREAMGGSSLRSEHPGVLAIARLGPGVTLTRAREEMNEIAARLGRQYPQTNAGHGINVESLQDSEPVERRGTLVILVFAVGFVMLIACANVATLMLARGLEHGRGIAIRVVLGSGRLRIGRQVLAESLVLTLISSLMGWLMAFWGVAAVRRMGMGSMDSLSLDRNVLWFAFALSLCTALVFGIFPAWQVSRSRPIAVTCDWNRDAISGRGHRSASAALVVFEVAISIVLLVGAGLALKSLQKVLRTSVGFTPSGLLAANLSFPDSQHSGESKKRVGLEKLKASVASLPGVESVGYEQPLLGGNQVAYLAEEHRDESFRIEPILDLTQVSQNAIQTMGVSLLEGRFFDSADTEHSARVCIVDNDLARSVWPGESAIGKHLSLGRSRGARRGDPLWWTVVGVVGHVKNYGADQPSREEAYVSYVQGSLTDGALIIRSSESANSLNAQLADLGSDVAISTVCDLGQMFSRDNAPRRLTVGLLCAFAGLTILLAAAGVYCALSYLVTLRRREIGMRIVLGASPGSVMNLVVRSGSPWISAGIFAGLVAAFSLGRFLQPMLFEVTATDASIFLCVPVFVGCVALAACYLPARRASRASLIEILRNER